MLVVCIGCAEVQKKAFVAAGGDHSAQDRGARGRCDRLMWRDEQHPDGLSLFLSLDLSLRVCLCLCMIKCF